MFGSSALSRDWTSWGVSASCLHPSCDVEFIFYQSIVLKGQFTSDLHLSLPPLGTLEAWKKYCTGKGDTFGFVGELSL